MSRARIPLFLVAERLPCTDVLCEQRRRGDRTHSHVHVHIAGNCRDEPIDGERRIGTIAEVTWRKAGSPILGHWGVGPQSPVMGDAVVAPLGGRSRRPAGW